MALSGQVQIVDVPTEFAAQLAAALSSRREDRLYRVGCSGGNSGAACWRAVAAHPGVDLARLEVFFVDERCVEPTSRDANIQTLHDALGARFVDLARCHPMSCAEGAQAYDHLLSAAGPLDLVQLGLGPDGHTASIFPGSSALDAPGDRLVVSNLDPSGRNAFDRLTLTYTAISAAAIVIVTVIGADKRAALQAIASGADLPAGRVRARDLRWLIDPSAAGDWLDATTTSVAR